MNPINAIGGVTNHINSEEYFLGTAFCYKSPRFLLTAAHMMPKDMTLLSITFPYINKVLVPTKIVVHDKYDIAALACTEKQAHNRDIAGIEFFDSIRKNLNLAEEFLTYGYTEDISKTKEALPTPRVFKGYYQRLFNYTSSMGYEYSAIELNIPCPKGLSGSPIIVSKAINSISGIVSENIEISTELHEEETENNTKYVYRKVINYGIAAKIGEIEDWIDEHYMDHAK